MAGSDLDFHFFSWDIAIFGELSHFSLLGVTSSILRTFLGGTSQKTHPVEFVIEIIIKFVTEFVTEFIIEFIIKLIIEFIIEIFSEIFRKISMEIIINIMMEISQAKIIEIIMKNNHGYHLGNIH